MKFKTRRKCQTARDTWHRTAPRNTRPHVTSPAHRARASTLASRGSYSSPRSSRSSRARCSAL
eukprot:2777412-Rhodomonas_salina.2